MVDEDRRDKTYLAWQHRHVPRLRKVLGDLLELAREPEDSLHTERGVLGSVEPLDLGRLDGLPLLRENVLEEVDVDSLR